MVLNNNAHIKRIHKMYSNKWFINSNVDKDDKILFIGIFRDLHISGDLYSSWVYINKKTGNANNNTRRIFTTLKNTEESINNDLDFRTGTRAEIVRIG